MELSQISATIFPAEFFSCLHNHNLPNITEPILIGILICRGNGRRSLESMDHPRLNGESSDPPTTTRLLPHVSEPLRRVYNAFFRPLFPWKSRSLKCRALRDRDDQEKRATCLESFEKSRSRALTGGSRKISVDLLPESEIIQIAQFKMTTRPFLIDLPFRWEFWGMTDKNTRTVIRPRVVSNQHIRNMGDSVFSQTNRSQGKNS
jgi:hypothetical protein